MTKATPPSSDALREQSAELRSRADEAQNRAAAARDSLARLRGLSVLGEATADEVRAAQSAADDAEHEADALAAALAEVATRLDRAETAEREQHRAGLADEAARLAKQRANAEKRIGTALASIRAAFEARDAAERTTARLRSEAIELRDLDRQETELNDRYRARLAELRRDAPPGMEPNVTSLELRYEHDLQGIRDAARAEAEALAPAAGQAALDEVLAEYADVSARLIAPELREALARGAEFLAPPEVMHDGQSFVGQTSRRIYAQSEGAEAESRFDAFRRAIDRLRGSTSAKSIAAEQGEGRVVQL